MTKHAVDLSHTKDSAFGALIASTDVFAFQIHPSNSLETSITLHSFVTPPKEEKGSRNIYITAPSLPRCSSLSTAARFPPKATSGMGRCGLTPTEGGTQTTTPTPSPTRPRLTQRLAVHTRTRTWINYHPPFPHHPDDRGC